MKFSLDYREHHASHAGLGASDSLIIPNGPHYGQELSTSGLPVIRQESGFRAQRQ
jgi:hypothetical protein